MTVVFLQQDYASFDMPHDHPISLDYHDNTMKYSANMYVLVHNIVTALTSSVKTDEVNQSPHRVYHVIRDWLSRVKS